MAVRQKQGTWKMITVLKSLTLFDDSFSLVSALIRSKIGFYCADRTSFAFRLLAHLETEQQRQE